MRDTFRLAYDKHDCLRLGIGRASSHATLSRARVGAP
jgi:hypothetical protein